ncbi:hypothetical protein KC360_g4013 [Hortaea werneckii]|nr:hypothetical protein KC325_g4040 [Hortaea werneckii]KAI6994354.1 hypothetical protein KC359_g4663 [Hortaea werneckii]KAI7146179.1 hypothetical protein KC344_g3886 [Hortaea werneckii]KAI7174900.1 hypothetical protein KC360_g4013 [Hortaea werneckii]KAI7510409.1 hypothetical protein KC347_g4323 [Hortaea werneckii]
MAAATSFPSLAVPPQDDNMEMSSPQNRNLDDDIDIDFDDSNYDGGVQLQDDEQMLTDGEQTRPATATDDMMDDDVQGEGFHFEQEAEMQDTQDLGDQPTAQEEDEELIDYGDDDYFIEDQQQPQIEEDTAVEDVTDEIEYGDEQQGEPIVHDLEPELQARPEQQAVQASQETVDEEIVRQPEEAGVAVQEPVDVATAEVLVEVMPGATEQVDAVTHAAPATEETVTYPEQSTGTSEQASFADGEKRQTVAAQPENAEPAEVPDEDAYAQPSAEIRQNEGEGAAEDPLAIDTTATATSTTYDREENPGTPTDTGLHPMTLYYNGSSMPLFKSKKLQDGLLKDDNLANLSLAELMRNCRQRLALKLGITIPEEQEMTLAFDHLGLLLSENSRAAYQHSLTDVLEVYLQLHQNDGTDDSPALSMTLSHQQFTSQLAVLQQAAASGKGMSAFVQPQYEEYNEQHEEYDNRENEQHEGEEYYQEDQTYYEEQAPIEEYTEDRHDEQPSKLINGEQNLEQGATDSYEEHQDAEEYQEDDTVPPEEYEYDEEGQDDQNDDTLEAHYDDHAAYYQEATENSEKPEHGAQPVSEAEKQHVQPSADSGVAHEAQEPAASISAGSEPSGVQTNESGKLPENAVEEVVGNVASPASSQTAQGNTADGEYNDWIDFDDDSDLTNGSAERADDKQEKAAEHMVADAHQQIVESDTANGEYDDWIDFDDDSDLTSGSLERTDDTQENGTEAAVANDQQHLGESEDFLNGQDQARAENNPHDSSVQQAQVESHDEQQTHDQEERDGFPHDLTEHQENDASLEYQPEDHDEAARGDGQTQHGPDPANGSDHEHNKEHIQTAQEKRISNIDEDIDFDEETTEQFEARKASEAGLNASTSGSPLGKRSRQDDDDDEIDFDDDEPETKKARAD